MDSISPDLIFYQARMRPSQLAAIDIATGRHWTYHDLDRDVNRAVLALVRDGVQPMDRVALLAPGSVDTVILHHALMRLGAVFVPLNWRLSPSELGRLLDDCSPTVLYCGDLTGYTTFTQEIILPRACRHLQLDQFIQGMDAPPTPPGSPGAETATQMNPPRGRQNFNVSADATAAIIYTSGTTGRPKGVRLTPRNMLASANNTAAHCDLDASSLLLCDMPLFHIMGLVVCVWSPLLRGGAVAIAPRFDVVRTNEALACGVGFAGGGGSERRGRRVTHYFCVPQMADAIAGCDEFRPERWTGLKTFGTAGAPNPRARIEWWLERGVAMVNSYGATEAGQALAMPARADVIRRKAGSVGLASPMAHVELVNVATGKPVPDGEVGELVVSGAGVTPGYWTREDIVGETVYLDLLPVDGKDCQLGNMRWYRTGDMARRDEDGFFWIVDRRKDMFISGGENVSPAEVEAALIQHPAVLDAAVVGVADTKWGEVGCAFIVLKGAGQTCAAVGGGGGGERMAASASDLARHCEALIARYKVPKEFRLVTALPRTASGKIQKHLLGELWSTGGGVEGQAAV